MGNYTILYMFENPRRGRQARNFTTNVPKILVFKSSSEQIFSRKLPLGAPVSWKRCWLVFSYHGKFSRFQVLKYVEYSAYTGCISLYIYCLITCNIKSLLSVPKISNISRKISQVSRFPAKSPDSQNKFVFLPKQSLLELSPPVTTTTTTKKEKNRKGSR